MFQQYDESIAYFAQALMIASCAFALIQLRALQKTSAMACLLLVILHLQYGSVLARLDVDALLSMVMVAWLVGQLDEQKPSSLITSLLILLFLSLIKEIGLYFAMTLLLLEIKLKHDRDTLLKALCITLIISLFHGLWSHYCNTQEFPRFASLRAWPLILQDFNPFHAASHPAQLIFIRDLVEAPIDRLNTPGIVWFGLIASMIYRFFKKDLDLSLIETSPALARQSLLGLCVIFGTYLLLLYELQVSTFHLGELHQGVRVDQVVTARRYFNLGFSPIVLFSFYMILAHYFKQRSSLHFYLRIFALSAAFIAYSYHHRLSVDDEYALGKSVSTALHAQELVAKGSHLCVAHEATTTGEAFAKKERFVLQLRHYLLDLNIAVAIEHPLHPCHYRIKMTDKNWTLQALSDEKDAHEP
jgi:hypothetical protein